MEKALSLFLVCLLTFCVAVPAFSVGAAEPEGELLRIRYLIADERDADGNLRRPYWVDEDGVEIEIPKPEADVSAAVAAETYPVSFDLRNSGCVTPVKDQAGTGSCWSFSTVACMESSMIRQGFGTARNTDYSEAHLAWFSQRQRTPNTSDPTYGDGFDAENPFDDGSNLFFSTSALMRGSGMQLESNAPWTNPQSGEDAMRDMAQPESSRYVSYSRLYDAEWFYSYSIGDVKQMLMQNGNVSMSYLHHPAGWNEEHACQYQNRIYGYSNHEVEIIGWDDNFPKENFNEGMQPRKDGAWLVKGSFGTQFGDRGYYWLSYYDPSIEDFFTLVAKPAETYDNIYQYDGTIPVGSASLSGKIIRAANRFRSTKKETLTHVSFWSLNEEASATVQVYVADEDYVPDSSDPTANMTLMQSATTHRSVKCGYYTVELTHPVDVSGRYFTVVLGFTAMRGYANMSFEGVGTQQFSVGREMSYSSQPGQSFIFHNKWEDCTDFYLDSGKTGNVSIKALTSNTASSTGYTLIYSANGGSGAPPTRKCSGAVTLSDAAPTRPGYIFLGWSENINATKPQYAPGTPLTIAASKTLFAVWKVDPNAPVAAIRGYVPERTERFFTTVEFAADVKNVPADAQAVWFVNGEPKQIGTDTFACVGAKQDYTVQVKLMQDKNPMPIAESAVETVQIRRSFTDILSSLFRLIFNRPYYVKQ